jgi:hypothetical protein
MVGLGIGSGGVYMSDSYIYRGERFVSRHAEGTFSIVTWEEQPLAEIDGERKLTTTTVTQKLQGGIEGEGSAMWLSAYFADGTAEFVGYQRIVGTVGDAQGSIVARISGHYGGSVARSEWAVIQGVGTGALHSMTGSGLSEATSAGTLTYSLDYDLG